MKKLSEVLKIGEEVTVYQQRGNNWRLPVLEISDDDDTALLDQKVIRANMMPRWYAIKVSKRGIPYAQG